jgi:glycosyltransferase involved in cell wall biosynthesis
MYPAEKILHHYSGEGDLIKEANCGISVAAENPDAIADGIMKLYSLTPEQRNKLGENGKNYVLKYHTYKYIADKFEEILK